MIVVRNLLAELQGKKDSMIELLGRFVQAESPSTDKSLVDSFSRLVERELEGIGCGIERVPVSAAGDHLLATWNASAPGKRVLLLAHMDTVWPEGEVRRRPFEVREGKVFGPGCLDMKAGIVQAVFALDALRGRQSMQCVPVTFLCTSDEETGSGTSRRLIEEEAKKSSCVLVLEGADPGGGSLKTSRKGVGRFVLRLWGKPSHAGAAHERGVSAVLELAHQVLVLQGMTDYDRGVTVNVGVVRGGTRSNVVPGYAEAMIDLRVPTQEEAGRATEAILGLKPRTTGVRLEVEGSLDRPPMERTPQTEGLFRLAREVGLGLGMELEESSSGGGSDGNFTQALGIPTLDGLGAVGNGAHAEDEFVLTDELPRRAALLAGLILALSREPFPVR